MGSRKCQHQKIYVDCAPGAQASGFERPPAPKRLAAATASGRLTANYQYATAEEDFNNGEIFPGPLALPNDAVCLEGEEPASSFKSWKQIVKSYGIGVTNDRKTIYVIPPPEVTSEVADLMSGWSNVHVPAGEESPDVPEELIPPRIDDLCDLLGEFYHGMPVKKFEGTFRWRLWNDTKRRQKTERRLGLETPDPKPELFGVKYRPSLDGIAKQQLHLNDILDAMLPRVPSDAHAIVMMIDYDLYEDEEDDFCCGRAYGGSRVCIVSSLRYHPRLDYYAAIELEHMWPASHCQTYVDWFCSESQPPVKRAKDAAVPVVKTNTKLALGAAVQAAKKTMIPKTVDDYNALWFSRVARTLSHEIGHCLTLGHCVYFSCMMQSTGGMAEDVRQPPYLCPICLEKLSYNLSTLVSGSSMIDRQRLWILGQHKSMKEYCRKWTNVGMFAGFEAWLGKRIEAMEGGTEQESEAPRKRPRVGDSSVIAQWLEDGE